MRHAMFSADGLRVLTASEDGTARVWNAATGDPITPPMRHRASVLHGDFSPDGKYVVTGSADSTAQVWSAETGAAVGQALKHESEVHQARFTPDGQHVVTACSDDTMFERAAQVWDWRIGKRVAVMKHKDGVVSARLSPNWGLQPGVTSKYFTISSAGAAY